MPKRMIDTDLWNDEKIIEKFTSEDKLFWFYLLTSPHNTLSGVFKRNIAVMARDTGYDKTSITNLLYRFENFHNLICVDEETNEIMILNWGKYNWNKSPKLVAVVEKECATIKSEKIRALLNSKISEMLGVANDTLSIGYRYPTDTNTNTITNNIVSIEDINTYFDKVYSIYPRKVSKVQGKTTFEKKLKGMQADDAHKKAVAIYRMLEAQIKVWQGENDGTGRKVEHVPHISTWLNANVEDSGNNKKRK